MSKSLRTGGCLCGAARYSGLTIACHIFVADSGTFSVAFPDS
jgi:hypothetical protein